MQSSSSMSPDQLSPPTPLPLHHTHPLHLHPPTSAPHLHLNPDHLTASHAGAGNHTSDHSLRHSSFRFDQLLSSVMAAHLVPFVFDAECFLILPRLSRGVLRLIEADECRLLRTRLQPALSMADQLLLAELEVKAQAKAAGVAADVAADVTAARAVSLLSRVELTLLYLRLQRAASWMLDPLRAGTVAATRLGESDGEAEEKRVGCDDAGSCAVSYRELPLALQLTTILAVLTFGTGGGGSSSGGYSRGGGQSQTTSVTSEGDGQPRGSKALAAVCEVYGIRWLCGLSTVTSTSQSCYDWLKESGCSSWTRERGEWPAEPDSDSDPEASDGGRPTVYDARLEAIFPEYVTASVDSFIENNDERDSVRFAQDELGLDLWKGLTLHPHSRSSFAQQPTQQLPDDWLVYLNDLCRGRVVWFAGTCRVDSLTGHGNSYSLIGLLLPASSSGVTGVAAQPESDTAEKRGVVGEWDRQGGGLIVKWGVSAEFPQPLCYSWSDFVQFREITQNYYGDAPNRGNAEQQRCVSVWPALLGDRPPPPRVVSRHVSPTATREVLEQIRHGEALEKVRLTFEDLLSTTISAYSPGYAAFHQSNWESVRGPKKKNNKKRRKGKQNSDEVHRTAE